MTSEELFDWCCKQKCEKSYLFECDLCMYEKGRADKDKELSELPNQYSEKLWKNAYEKGKADGIREFAEWISNTEYVANHDSFILPLRGYFTIDEIVKEFNKEQNNGK